MIAFCTNATNDGLSVWVAQGRQGITYLRSKPKGIPQLNSNDVYLVLEQKHNHSVLNDRPYTFFKAHFWIGSHSKNHQAKVERAMNQLDEVVEAHTD